MSIKKSNALLLSILSQPEKAVPGLTNQEIRRVLIHAISLYMKQKICLDTLAKIAASIKKYHTSPLIKDIDSIIMEMATYVIISAVLTDILDELKGMKIKLNDSLR